MKPSLKIVSLVVVFAALLVLLTFAAPPFSDNKTPQLLAKANLFNMQFPQEKVYLHLDRSSYWAGDDIWFKAYLKDSPTPKTNLYVELLNSSGTLIQKKIYWSQNGLATGDFKLSDTISSGIYQVRAYTNWMRNFDEHWFFRKNLVIWNFKGKKMAADDSRQLRQRNIDLQFFPEGGTFVANLKTRMGFKATDENGKGLEVRGRIMDDTGNEIVAFESAFKGMGHFDMVPREGRKYVAEVIVADGVDMNVNLPIPEASGVSLSIDPMEEDLLNLKLVVGSGRGEPDLAYVLVASANGKVLFSKEIKIQNGFSALQLVKGDLPTGIVQFTLFDKEMIPRCERLVFVNNHDIIKVDIGPDKSVYHPGEKAQLLVEAFNKEDDPCVASLSMSVYHSDNQIKMDDYPNNILTHFLLGSELKGLVEDPAYYFKDDSLTTQAALDNLMLTHGYRHFEWKQMLSDQQPPIVFKPESGIKIKGTIKTSLTEKEVANGNVSLIFLHDTVKTYHAETDSTGQFEFKDFYFRDTVSVFLEAKTSKGRRSTFIELDKSSWESPGVKLLPLKYNYLDDSKVTVTFDQESLMKINRRWRLSDTIMLNEVQVATSKYKFGERPMRLYEKADYTLELDTDDDELGNVFHKLEDKFSDVIVRVYEEWNLIQGHSEVFVPEFPGDAPSLEPEFVKKRQTMRIDYSSGEPVYVLDGRRVKEELIHKIPAGAFKSVEILKNGMVYGNLEGGAVCFFTKYGAFSSLPNSQGEKNSRIAGYSVIRGFYSPNYETMPSKVLKDDFRNTLYWNPAIKTNSSGESLVVFYNSNQTGEVQVVVEGVTIDGKLCRGVCKYNVVSK